LLEGTYSIEKKKAYYFFVKYELLGYKYIVQ